MCSFHELFIRYFSCKKISELSIIIFSLQCTTAEIAHLAGHIHVADFSFFFKNQWFFLLFKIFKYFVDSFTADLDRSVKRTIALHDSIMTCGKLGNKTMGYWEHKASQTDLVPTWAKALPSLWKVLWHKKPVGCMRGAWVWYLQ